MMRTQGSKAKHSSNSPTLWLDSSYYKCKMWRRSRHPCERESNGATSTEVDATGKCQAPSAQEMEDVTAVIKDFSNQTGSRSHMLVARNTKIIVSFATVSLAWQFFGLAWKLRYSSFKSHNLSMSHSAQAACADVPVYWRTTLTTEAWKAGRSRRNVN